MISVIIPVYNAEKYLQETINTVLEQTYTDWELILVDDCSSDGSFQIATQNESADTRIHVIHSEKNLGASKSRNLGLDAAKGRYIAFLDADDIWNADKLTRSLQYLQENDFGFVFTGYEFADEKAVGTGKIVHVPTVITYRQALKNTTIFTSTVIFDTEKISKSYIYMPQVASEDTATWWQILRKTGPAHGLNENLVLYRRSSNTLSSNKLEAVKRIWYLYRKVEKLNFFYSAYNFAGYAIRAVIRRV